MLATTSLDARTSNFGPVLPATRRLDTVILLALAFWVVASRLPYLNDFDMMGKDGPLYIGALALDEHYNVPMPGNIGYVLLGKLAQLLVQDPVRSFLAVNIALTVLGAGFCYLFASLIVPRPLAAALTFALSCNPIVWYHGAIIASYPVWLAVLPAIGWFGVRYKRAGRFGDLIGASVALGAGMICRPDLLFFGVPLWFGCLALGRAPWRHWLLGGAIVAVACACWFFGTAWVLGGVDVYLERVKSKHEFDRTGYSLFARGIVEGLMRNGVKYVLFLAWGASITLLPFAWGVGRELAAWRARWRGLLLALLWVGPSWYFSFLIFAGNAGLIFPMLPLLYLAAARGFQQLLGPSRTWRAVAAMLLVGAASLAQFVGIPIRAETNQRDVILNVMFLRYSGAGILGRYNYNLDDYGVSPSLASVSRQMRAPETLPVKDVTVRR
jgi:MFS family permease